MNIAKLIYTTGPDWIYKTELPISDPHFLYVDTKGKSHAHVGPLEYAIAQRKHTIDHLYTQEELTAKLPEGEAPTLANMIQILINEDAPETIEVAEDFPAFLFETLHSKDIPLSVAKGLIFPERMIKTPKEIDKMRKAQALNEKGFSRIEEILSEAEISENNALLWQGAPLTSEALQGEMNKIFAAAGADSFAGGPIVAGGTQGAIPHERGNGPLFAHELIVVDSFPQHPNHYYGDLTRTYLKGNASDWQKRVYTAVLGAQEFALSLVKPGIPMQEIQKEVVTYFKDHGFETSQTKGTYYGYTHGIGHHIGLQVHDGAQQRQKTDYILKPGHVITIEPGLYYPKGTHKEGDGGCRIEDIITVTEDGHTNLTTHQKSKWIIE